MAGTVPKDYRQMLKRLEREGIVAGMERHGPHPTVLLSCGLRYTCPSTPSDWRSLKNTESQIRRLHKQSAPGYTGSALKRNVPTGADR